MNLHFNSKYKSIESFTDIHIPDFSIFTGKNGSGKTHILQAIKNGNIAVDAIPLNKILLLNYLDFEHNFQVKAGSSQKNDAWNRLNNGNGNDLVYQLKNQEGSITGYKEIIERVAQAKEKAIFDLKEEDFEEENKIEIITAIKHYKEQLLALLSNDNFVNEDIPQSVYDSVIVKSQKFLSGIEEDPFKALFQKTAISGRKILSDLSNIFFGISQKYKKK